MPRTFAFGDIHGYRHAFQALLAEINPQANDTLIFLGDMIDRGSDSKGVLDDIMALSEQCQVIAIQGNHEQLMLESLEYGKSLHSWLQWGGAETLESFELEADIEGLETVPAKYFYFMRNCRDYYETERFIFTHATPSEDVPISQQNEYELRWQRPQHDWPYQHCSGKTVVCGHTSLEDGNPFAEKGLIMLDTYICGGQWLTALDMDSLVAYQANENGDTRLQGLVLT